MEHLQEPINVNGKKALDEDRQMTADELIEAKRYGQQELVCSLLDKVIDLVYLGAMALAVAYPLDQWLSSFVLFQRYDSLRLMALFLIIVGGHIGVSFPLSCYSGYLLEHQYGLSNLSWTSWFWRYTKRNLLTVGFGMAMFLGLYWLIWTTGSLWWLFSAGAFFVVSVLLGQLVPVLIIPLFYNVEKISDEEISQRLEKLTHGTGLSIEGVYRLDLSAETAKANAMLAGLGRTRRVLLGDTLLKKFTTDEIEVIFAHEVAHHVFRHIHKMMIAGLLYSAVGFWICDRLLGWYVEGHSDASMPVYSLPFLMFILNVFSLVVEPLQNTISRYYERQCDLYALDQTGLRKAYRSAFQKLAKINKDDPHPHPWAVLLFHSHPPISERLSLADNES